MKIEVSPARIASLLLQGQKLFSILYDRGFLLTPIRKSMAPDAWARCLGYVNWESLINRSERSASANDMVITPFTITGIAQRLRIVIGSEDVEIVICEMLLREVATVEERVQLTDLRLKNNRQSKKDLAAKHPSISLSAIISLPDHELTILRYCFMRASGDSSSMAIFSAYMQRLFKIIHPGLSLAESKDLIQSGIEMLTLRGFIGIDAAHRLSVTEDGLRLAKINITKFFGSDWTSWINTLLVREPETALTLLTGEWDTAIRLYGGGFDHAEVAAFMREGSESTEAQVLHHLHATHKSIQFKNLGAGG